MHSIAYVGIDAHDESLSLAIAVGDLDPVKLPPVLNDEADVKAVFKSLAQAYDLRCCYESSGVGFVIHRWLKSIGVKCEVIAASLIPQKAGDRIKTDDRDARKLAALYRAGQLTPVHIPTESEEAVRSVVRLRESFVRDITESKNMINKFLSCRGRFWRGKSRWTQTHWAWMQSQKFSEPEEYVWSEMLAMLQYKMARAAEVERRIAQYAELPAFKQRVERLCCMRGIALLTAMTLVVELFEFTRFKSARALMAFMGLVPAERSSGQSRHQGGITKAGNARTRRVIIEAAWKYARKPTMSAALKKRQENQPPAVIAHSWKAQQRLYKKYWSIGKRKAPQIAVVATARELIGFVWAILAIPVAAA